MLLLLKKNYAEIRGAWAPTWGWGTRGAWVLPQRWAPPTPMWHLGPASLLGTPLRPHDAWVLPPC